MRTHMTVAARRELALRTAVRYKNAARPEKKRILDEFLESTGFHRKHATRLLNDILRGERPRRQPRGRVRRYEYHDGARYETADVRPERHAAAFHT